MAGNHRWLGDLRMPSNNPPVGAAEDVDVGDVVDEDDDDVAATDVMNLTRREARPMSATAGVVCPVISTGSTPPSPPVRVAVSSQMRCNAKAASPLHASSNPPFASSRHRRTRVMRTRRDAIAVRL